MRDGRRVGDWIADRYEIFDIHTGGMGVVYVVYDHQGVGSQRVLAIKTLRDEYLRDRRSNARFTSECNAWVRLDRHPHIVRAFSVQEIEGKPHAVVELVTGGDLRRWIGTPRLDLRQALRFAVQFCLGMEYATQKGLHCHRDIKPENLLISDGGLLKITDFGLAKVRDEATTFGGPVDFAPIPLSGLEEPLSPGVGVSEPPSPSAGPSPPAQGPAPAADDTGWSSFPKTPADTMEVPSSGSSDAAPAPGRRPSPPAFPNGAPLPTVTWVPDAAPSGLSPDQGIGPSPGSPVTLDPIDPAAPGQRVVTVATIAPSLEKGVTRVGVMLGTGPYMAPEQFRDAKAVDFRADIYSFGIVLFEMIAGHRPFQGDTFEKLARQHDKAPPPSIVQYIPGRNAKVAKAIDKVIQRCLAKKAEQRFSSYYELRRALASCLWRVAREQIAPPTESELEAWELTNKGVSLGTLGRHDEERASYEAALKIKPDYTPAWFNQAAALGASGHLEEGVEYADVALHLNGQSVPALVNKALALNALGRSEEALALLSTAARLQPREPEVWYSRAFVLLNLGNVDGARSALGQALRLRPNYPEALYAFGVALSRTAPWPEAEAFFLRANDRVSSRAVADYHARGELPNLRNIPWIRRTEDSLPDPALA